MSLARKRRARALRAVVDEIIAERMRRSVDALFRYYMDSAVLNSTSPFVTAGQRNKVRHG